MSAAPGRSAHRAAYALHAEAPVRRAPSAPGPSPQLGATAARCVACSPWRSSALSRDPAAGDPLHGPALGARPTRARQRARRRRRGGRAAGARPRARRGGRDRGAAPVDRAAPGRGSRGRWRVIAARAGTLPYLGTRWSSCHRRGARRVHRSVRGCWCPPAMRARRSSASTGAPPARRSPPRLDRATRVRGHAPTPALDIRGQRTRWASCSCERPHELQLAADAGARAGARLRRLARGLPPRDDRPLAALLGAAWSAAGPSTATSASGCARNGATLVLWARDRRRSREPIEPPQGAFGRRHGFVQGGSGPSPTAPASRPRGRRRCSCTS